VDAERTDVRARLARHAEDREVPLVVELDERVRVDGTHAQLALDRRDEGRALEEGASERLETGEELALALQRAVQPQHRHVLLARALLRLDQTRRTVDAHNQAASHLGVEGARVAGLLDAEYAADPRDHLVRRRVCRLVQVDHAVLEVLLQRPLERRVPRGDGRVVARAHAELVVILEQQRPLGRCGGEGGATRARRLGPRAAHTRARAERVRGGALSSGGASACGLMRKSTLLCSPDAAAACLAFFFSLISAAATMAATDSTAPRLLLRGQGVGPGEANYGWRVPMRGAALIPLAATPQSAVKRVVAPTAASASRTHSARSALWPPQNRRRPRSRRRRSR
jgi:hypothetical protein